MKRILSFVASLLCTAAVMAQSVDTFKVGPYTVDYYENGGVQFRLRDNIDLYEFYGLSRDTIVKVINNEFLVKKAIQISIPFESSVVYATKGVGLEAVWKQNIWNHLFINAGISLNFDFGNYYNSNDIKRYAFEVGIPLQIEYGKMSTTSGSLYANIGILPSFYSNYFARGWKYNEETQQNERANLDKKAGIFVAPTVEFGGNIPLSNVIMRIGVVAKHKLNLSKKDGYDIYYSEIGRAFVGAKIGVVF